MGLRRFGYSFAILGGTLRVTASKGFKNTIKSQHSKNRSYFSLTAHRTPNKARSPPAQANPKEFGVLSRFVGCAVRKG